MDREVASKRVADPGALVGAPCTAAGPGSPRHGRAPVDVVTQGVSDQLANREHGFTFSYRTPTPMEPRRCAAAGAVAAGR